MGVCLKPRGPKRPQDRSSMWWSVRGSHCTVWWWRQPRWRGVGPVCGAPVLCTSVFLSGCPEWLKFVEEFALKKPSLASANSEAAVLTFSPSVLFRPYPVLDQLFGAPTWPDGSSKGEVTMWLTCQPSICKMMVSLKGLALKALLSAHCLDDVLALWVMGLESDQVPWELDTRAPQPKKERAKKVVDKAGSAGQQ